MDALAYLARRIGLSTLALLGLATLVFAMIKVIPGDQAQVIAGEGASREQVEAVRANLGLDAPVPVQYLRYVLSLLRFDLGTSSYTHRSVSSEIGAVLPMTVQLVALSLVIAVLIAFPLAIVAAVKRGGGWDTSSRILVIFAGGFPVFWVAMMGQYLFGSHLRVLPISGGGSAGHDVPTRTGMSIVDALLVGDLTSAGDAVYHLVLPATVLVIPIAAILFRTLRVDLVEVLRREHIRVARAKGVPVRTIVLSHALPNALGPSVTIVALEFGLLIPSAVLVETVFGLPGIGSRLTTAVDQRDMAIVLGCVVTIGAIVIAANFIGDVAQMAIDPRMRSSRSGGSPKAAPKSQIAPPAQAASSAKAASESGADR